MGTKRCTSNISEKHISDAAWFVHVVRANQPFVTVKQMTVNGISVKVVIVHLTIDRYTIGICEKARRYVG